MDINRKKLEQCPLKKRLMSSFMTTLIVNVFQMLRAAETGSALF